MNARTAATKLEREFAFNDNHFELLRECVREHTGIALSDAKRELVYGRLSRRLRNLGIDNFDAYCSLITAGDKEEIAHFVNAITTNLTAFFRESHHFGRLAALLPHLIEMNQGTRRLRLWSAGCSTGEEAYSIAITVREAIGDPPGWDVKILATDIDSNVLAAAANGVYHPQRADGLSRERLSRWFLRGQGKNAGMLRVVPDLQDLITFRQLNLMQPWPLRGPFDVLFCRNVVIYFGKETQRTLFNRFADVLAPGGHLFIGHSESLFKVSERFKLLGKTAYQRIS